MSQQQKKQPHQISGKPTVIAWEHAKSRLLQMFLMCLASTFFPCQNSLEVAKPQWRTNQNWNHYSHYTFQALATPCCVWKAIAVRPCHLQIRNRNYQPFITNINHLPRKCPISMQKLITHPYNNPLNSIFQWGAKDWIIKISVLVMHLVHVVKWRACAHLYGNRMKGCPIRPGGNHNALVWCLWSVSSLKVLVLVVYSCFLLVVAPKTIWSIWNIRGSVFEGVYSCYSTFFIFFLHMVWQMRHSWKVGPNAMLCCDEN